MEQVRMVLAWMGKHHFWLLSGVAVLLAFVVWYLAASDLAERKKANLQTIKQAFDKQQQLAAKQPKPSDEVLNQQSDQIKAIAAETERIWQELYDRQRQDVLKWPQQLPKGFLNEIESKQFGDDISITRRDQYGDYIRGRFADLPKLINANEVDEDATGGGFGGRGGGRAGGEFGGYGAFGDNAAGGMEDEQGNLIEPDYTVYWSDEDQLRIKSDLDWPTRQSHWRIWVTQEDLWVYETMLRAIAATNEAKGATRQSNAAITVINYLQVGRDAAQESRTSGRIKRLQGANSLTGGDEMMGDPMDRGAGGPGEFDESAQFGGGGREGEFGGGEGDQLDPAQEKARWLSRRYIDDQGLPISVSPDEMPLDPTTFGQEIKRLPVRMVLQMDARWLPKLISELANADLQIKVTEVRVGVDPESSGGGGGGEFGGGGGRGRSFSGGGGGRGEFGGGFGGGFGNTEVQVFDRKPFMKPVVIQGVVLIFNRPNQDILNKGDGSDIAPETITANIR